jgi:hypothetical protein
VREAGPSAVALEYARALYTRDLGAVHRLVSSEDQQAKDEHAFRVGEPSGFALDVTRRLGSFVSGTVVDEANDGTRATGRLRLRLPDARAPAIAGLVRQWDERQLNELSPAARAEILRNLDDLRGGRALPTVEGEQTFELVKQGADWRIVAGWTSSVRVAFHATIAARIPLEVTVLRLRVTMPPAQAGWIADAIPLDVSTPSRAVIVAPGERVRVVLAARNVSRQDVTARVGHRIEPATQPEALAILRCPLLLPLMLAAGESDEFLSEYLLLPGPARATKAIDVTYEIRREP